MKISLISGSYPNMKCGIGDYTSRLSRALSRLGHSVSVLTSTGAESRWDENVTVFPSVERWDWNSRSSVMEFLQETSADLVNIQYPTQQYGRHSTINLLPYLISRECGIPVVFSIHEYSTFRTLGKMRIALSTTLSTRAIVPDRLNLVMMSRQLPWLAKRLHHVPIGPNIDSNRPQDYVREEWRRSFGAKANTLVIAYFGFISPSKGIETLLQSLEKLAGISPGLDWKLLFIASKDPAHSRFSDYHHKIVQLLDSSPIRQNVFWTGHAIEPDVSRNLWAADICVLPFSDGASLRRTTLLSALSHGLPVISTRANPFLDVELKDGKNLLLVPANDADALAGAIALLARDEEMRQSLSRGAFELSAQFSWEEIGKNTIQVYEEALASFRRGAIANR